jgi:hypothetical protein
MIKKQSAWNSTSQIVEPTTPITTSNFMSGQDDPMQIDSTRFKSLIQEEKYRRRSKGLCLYCGEPNHIAQNCPNKGRFKARVATSINKNPLLENKSIQSQ